MTRGSLSRPPRSGSIAPVLCDKPRASLIAKMHPEPAQDHTKAGANANQVIDVRDAPEPLGKRTAQLDPAEVDHRPAQFWGHKRCGLALFGRKATTATVAHWPDCRSFGAVRLQQCNANRFARSDYASIPPDPSRAPAPWRSDSTGRRVKLSCRFHSN